MNRAGDREWGKQHSLDLEGEEWSGRWGTAGAVPALPSAAPFPPLSQTRGFSARPLCWEGLEVGEIFPNEGAAPMIPRAAVPPPPRGCGPTNPSVPVRLPDSPRAGHRGCRRAGSVPPGPGVPSGAGDTAGGAQGCRGPWEVLEGDKEAGPSLQTGPPGSGQLRDVQNSGF